MLIMGDEEEALEARLFHLATLANQLSGFYFRRCPPLDQILLSTTLGKSLTQDECHRCAETINSYYVSEPLAVSLVIPIIQLLQQHDAGLEISQLIKAIEEQHPAAMVEGILDAEYFRQEIIKGRHRWTKASCSVLIAVSADMSSTVSIVNISSSCQASMSIYSSC